MLIHHTKRVAAGLLAGGAVLMSIPWNATAASESVDMRDYAFSMPAMQVAVGDTVTWTNQDKALHDATTTSAPVKFASPYLKTGESWSYTFTAPGVYSYVCSLHPKMVASITAIGAAPPPTPVPTKAKPEAKAVAKPVARAAGRPTPTPVTTPTPSPAATPKTTPKAKAAKVSAAAPANPVPAVVPAVVPVVTANTLDLMPAVEIGGLTVGLVVGGLLAYGFVAGRRTG